MQTLVERGCGLDVHQATVVACLFVVPKDGRLQKQLRTFGTTTRELVGLRDWLRAEGCTHLAMESTGVYWKPVYAVLEGELEIVVANAQHVKKVPGRKTDVKDAEWLADLLCHGLLRSAPTHPRTARLDALSAQAGAKPSRRAQPTAETTGVSQHQVGQRSHGCIRSLGPLDAARSHRGANQPEGDGPAG